MLAPLRPRKDDPLYEEKLRRYKQDRKHRQRHPERWGMPSRILPGKSRPGDGRKGGRKEPAAAASPTGAIADKRATHDEKQRRT